MRLLTNEEINKQIPFSPGWKYEKESLSKEFVFKDFASAVGMINRIAPVADEMNHHPDILLHGWNKLQITVSTHSEGGVTELDFSLIKKIDELKTDDLM